METFHRDIEALNQQLFEIATGERGEEVLRLLGANPAVNERIRAAGAEALRVAARRGVPFLVLSERGKELLVCDPRKWSTQAVSADAGPLAQLTHLALEITQRVARVDPTLVQTHFGLSWVEVERLLNLEVVQLIALSARFGVIHRLRAADHLDLWDRILIADRYSGPDSARISQQMAVLSLGVE